MLQSILRAGFAAFARVQRQPQHVWRAAWAVMSCRTAALGAHRLQCPQGHVSILRMNSCGHRACPQCWYARMLEWLENCSRTVLPVAHFHVVFTCPSAFNELWRWNRRRLAKLLFRCVRETLLEMLAGDRHLGAQPGVIAALHTWGRTLSFHPHVHCVVSAGGLDPHGAWRACPNGFLLPGRAVRVVFAGKFLSGLERLWKSGALTLPPRLHDDDMRQLLIAQAAQKWNVHIDAPVGGPRGVIGYLARYLRGGPVKNHRLLRFDSDVVALRYRRAGDPTATDNVLTLPINEFIRRWADHVPVPGLHMVRRWGLYAARNAAQLAVARSLLPPPAEKASHDAHPALPSLPERTCPVCHIPLVVVDVVPRPGSPPRREAFAAA